MRTCNGIELAEGSSERDITFSTAEKVEFGLSKALADYRGYEDKKFNAFLKRRRPELKESRREQREIQHQPRPSDGRGTDLREFRTRTAGAKTASRMESDSATCRSRLRSICAKH